MALYRFISIIIFYCFAMVMAFAAKPTYVVSGRILSEIDSIPVRNAICEISNSDGKISEIKSSEDGSFYFNIAPGDSYIIKISKDGFRATGVKITNLKTDINVGDCFLNNETDLDELIVTGTSKVNINDKILITPGEFEVKSSVKAPEMISKLGIPGLFYDILNKSITINNERPVILINGNPASEKELESIKATEVLNVEFSNNVPLNYRSIGNSIINVKLKKRSDGGSVSISSANNFNGSAVDPDIFLDYHSGPSKFSGSYSFNYRHNYKTYDTSDTRYKDSNLPIQITENLYNPFLYTKHNAILKYECNPDESLAFSATATFSAYNRLQKTSGTADDSALGIYSISKRHSTKSLTPNIDLFFSKVFGDNDLLQVNVTGRYNYDYYDFNNQFKNELFENIYRSTTKGNRYALISSAYYMHEFPINSRLSFCYENLISKNTNIYNNNGNEVKLSENNNFLYAEYGQKLKFIWINLITGIRLDNIDDCGTKRTFINNHSKLSVNLASNSNFYFYADISYIPDNFSPRMLIDEPQQTDSYSISTGNPHLKRAKNLAQNLTLGYSDNIKGINWSVYLRANHNTTYNPIINTAKYDSEKDAYIIYPDNFHLSNLYSAALNLQVSNILKMFGIYGEVCYNHSRLNNIDWQKTIDNISGYFSIYWNYKKWTIQYSKSFPRKILTGNSVRSSEFYDNLTLRFGLNKHFNFQLQWFYMFSKKGWEHEFNTYAPNYEILQHREIHDFCNMIKLTITYDLNFGQIFKSKSAGRMIKNNDSETMVNKFSY